MKEIPGKISIGLICTGLFILLFPSLSRAGVIENTKGKILLGVQSRGEAWYVYPDTGERYYLGGPEDAFETMKKLGLGITDADLAAIPIAADSAIPEEPGREEAKDEARAQYEQRRAWTEVPSEGAEPAADWATDDIYASAFRISAKYDPPASKRYGDLVLAVVAVIGTAVLFTILLKRRI